MKKKASVKEKEYVEDDDHDVLIMDEEINYANHHEPGSEDITWGVFLIFAGIVLLLNTFRIIPWDIWRVLLRFWPVLIIIAGFQMILRGNRVANFFSNSITLALFSWIVLVALNEVTPEFIEKLPNLLKQPIEWWEVIQG